MMMTMMTMITITIKKKEERIYWLDQKVHSRKKKGSLEIVIVDPNTHTLMG